MFLPGILRDTYYAVLDVVYPPLCLGCEEFLERHERFVCIRCWQSIRRVSADDTTVRLLKHRLTEQGPVDRIFSLYYFEERGSLQPIIHALKYRGLTSVGFELGKKVGEAIRSGNPQSRFDCVVPVPLHRSKYRERGYNQSEYIARGIADVLNIRSIDLSAVKRIRPTDSQTRLTVEERRANIEGAFRVVRPARIEGKHLLLVDDVITTGATVTECARVIKDAGANVIDVASIALARSKVE